MKKITFIILIIVPLQLMAQTLEFTDIKLHGIVNKKISSSLSENTKVELTGFIKSLDGFHKAKIISNGEDNQIDLKRLDRIDFVPNSIKEFWQIKSIENDVYQNLITYGYQFDLRKELEEEAIEYLNQLIESNLCFDDIFLESYIYSLIYKIYPLNIEDGRPGFLNVKILKSSEPNAFIFPNGMLFISTGLISTVNSEEELISVLAHEIAHFILDHSIININKATERQKRAEFWAAFATGLAAAADIYASTKNEYYNPGLLTMSTAYLSYSVASLINERMGIKYTKEQELIADKCAVDLLKYININPLSLSSSLNKIKNYCIITGNYYAISGSGTHPAIEERIRNIGKPIQFNNNNYDKIISFVNTYNAIIEFNNNHLNAALELAERNVKANVATEDDYIILAMINLYLHDNEEQNIITYNYINKAKSLNINPNINICKQEAIILLRLKKITEAKQCLTEYKELLKSGLLDIDRIVNQYEWSNYNNYYHKEIEWASKMIYKINEL